MGYGKQVINNGINKIKNAIKRKMMPYIIIAIVICFFFIIIAGMFAGEVEEANAAENGMQSASGSSWEQFLKYVETKEGGTNDGTYYFVEDDGGGVPTIGHGLALYNDGHGHQSELDAYGYNTVDLVNEYNSNGYVDSKVGHKICYSAKVPIEVCDEIWSNHLKGLYESILSSYESYSLKEYQYYALTDVKYRRGTLGAYKVTDGFSTDYENLWSDSDNKYGEYNESSESFSTSTLFNFFWDGGHSLEGVNTRKKDQWVLFKYGYYRPLKEYWTEGSSGSADTQGLVKGDYKGIYKSSSSGLSFIEYYQDAVTWGSDKLTGTSSGNDLAAAGCHVTSMAIALTAVTGEQITPRMVNNAYNFMTGADSGILLTSSFSKYESEVSISGLKSGTMSESTLKSNLGTGKTIILRFKTTPWTSSGSHYVVAADYKDGKVYIINPGTWGKEGTTAGWVEVSQVTNYLKEYIFVTTK